MRTASSIEKALPESLLATYREQLSAIRKFVGQAEEGEALRSLEEAMVQVFRKSFGLAHQEAEALASLAVKQPGEDPAMPAIRVVSERCALQRALVASGLAAKLRPLYVIAAEAILTAAGIPDSMIVVQDPLKQAARIPTLPPIHHQSTDLENAGHSRLFAMKWE